MKKLALASLLIPLTLLVVCKTQKNGVQRVGTDLYNVTSVERISIADRDTIREALLKYYDFGDIKQEWISISRNDPRNIAGYILAKSFRKGVVTDGCIDWKNTGRLPKEGIQIRVVLNKYAVR